MGKLEEFGKMYGANPTAHENIPPHNNEVVCSEEPKIEAPINSSEVTENHMPPIELDSMTHMSWIKIEKIVTEKTGQILDNLSIIYTALHETAETITLVIKKEKDGLIQLYLGVRDKKGLKNYISKYLLQRGLYGCLPGISYIATDFSFSKNEDYYVSYTSGIPSLKNEKKEGFVQGIERLINSTSNIPSFVIVLLAENKSVESVKDKRIELAKKYSQLSGQAEKTTTNTENFGEQESTTTTKSTTESSTNGSSNGTNCSHTDNGSKSKTDGSSVAFLAGVNSGESNTTGTSDTSGTTTTNSQSSTLGKSESSATTNGKNKNSGKSIQIKEEDKKVKEELKNIEKRIERTYGAETYGNWSFSTYFLADTQTTSYILACIYKGLICGTNLNIDGINTYSWNQEESSVALDYLQHFKHPSFANTSNCPQTTEINSFELAIGMSLPMSSVPGILVKEQAGFGRNVISSSTSKSTIQIGTMLHLGCKEKGNNVKLDEELLTSHVFVTGTTGSGKSNTIYLILSKLREEGKHFLIIEPAKGEYKNVFGGYEDVKVYGTNPKISEQIKLNPFSFPSNVHIEEHIDRLIDIFNACWPMYAAMPAVLKEAICRAYESCGWDLVRSIAPYNVFPTFEDVKRELSNYVNESEYSSDTKGDYKGALETRLQSLNSGIVGNIFKNKPINDEELFNSNVIIDLSRVGSAETKSLIMGILLIKLNEFRLSENKGMNLPLRHVTVLEEAHNLLRATSNVQSQESSNLAGKSVEMLSAAIAEMRTYGESFIIADQSPSLLDRSAISNTNTKIVMNLPNKSDREISAHSIGLTEEQSNELSKLKTGDAVVYQKGWEEPVECTIDYFEDIKPFEYVIPDSNNNFQENVIKDLYSSYVDIPKFDSFVDNLEKSGVSGSSLVKIMTLLQDDNLDAQTLVPRIFVLYVGEKIFLHASKLNNIEEFNYTIENKLKKIDGIDSSNIETFLNMYIKGCSIMNKTNFYDNWLQQYVELKRQ